MHSVPDKKVLMLRPEEIMLSPYNLRQSVDTYELDRLGESIAANGIIEPLCIKKDANGNYRLIAGARRLAAAKNVKLRRVPCILHNTDDISAILFSLTENMQRENLNFFEEADALEKILSLGNFSQSELSLRLGIAGSTLCNKLRLLRLDNALRSRIISASLSERHARALLQVPEEKREELLNKIIASNLNIKQTESEIESILNPKETKEKNSPVRKAAIGDIRLFANSLSKLIDTLNSAGIPACSKRQETSDYIEYKVRIPKHQKQNETFEQMAFC